MPLQQKMLRKPRWILLRCFDVAARNGKLQNLISSDQVRLMQGQNGDRGQGCHTSESCAAKMQGKRGRERSRLRPYGTKSRCTLACNSLAQSSSFTWGNDFSLGFFVVSFGFVIDHHSKFAHVSLCPGFRMKAYDKAVEEKHPTPSKHVEGLRLKGWYRCCYPKWRKVRDKHNWPLICRAAPKLAKRYRECPDVIKEFLGQPKKFLARCKSSEGTTSILPMQFQTTVANSVAARLRLYISVAAGLNETQCNIE